MRARPIPLLLLLNALTVTALLARTIPLVYDVENTGAAFPPPVLPSISELPTIHPLTDPFRWSDGSNRTSDRTGYLAYNEMVCHRRLYDLRR